MLAQAIIYWVSIFGIVLIGLSVFFRNRKTLYRWFVFFTATLAIWLSCQYFFDQATSLSKLWVQLSFIAFELMAGSFFAFLYAYPDSRSIRFSRQWLLALPLLIFGPFTFSPLLAKDVTINDGVAQFVPGPLYLYQTIAGLVYFLAAIAVLLARLRTSSYQQKNQIRILLLAFIIPIIVNALGGTLYLDSALFQALRPISVFVMIALIVYTMIYHHLFDLRLVITRSIGYIVSIGFLVLVFAFSSSLIIGSLLSEETSQLTITLTQSFILVVGVLLYPPVKRFFDKVTNQIFYRDAYDPQTFLDNLNKTLVSNIETGILLRHTAQVIGENIKAECHIYVKGTDEIPTRTMGTSTKSISADDLETLRTELATIKDKTVVTDELEDHYVELREVLEKNKIAVISGMVTNYAASHEATAYLLLGSKKSGNAFTKQDLRIIDIISDELLIAIQNALRFEEIQSFNITLQKRINEATNKLKRSNDKLKELDETKDEFISMASHQLRTPLTSVKGYLSMVLDGDAGKISPNQQELLNQAFVSSQRMVYLIADLLNMSRLKTGKFIIDAHPTNLADIVESELQQLKEVAKGRKLTLEYQKPKEFPVLELDETKTRQVIMNFVDNAIYYTPSGGKIKIELSTDRSSVYFMVKDNGLGVPKEEQSHMFTKFYRAKNAQKARPDGTGLGLFMAKKVITDQGGTILFESVEGKGSTFGFKFDKPKEK